MRGSSTTGKKGGGLPIVILNDDAAKDAHVLERTIVPVLMKERLEFRDEGTKHDEKISLDLRYTVTEAGPFYADVVPGSHSAVVTFEFDETASFSDCVMTWNVTFSTTKWASFYETVTRWTVGTAATTVREASSAPRLLSAKTTIIANDNDNDSDDNVIDPAFARAEVLDFVFGRGGGLPLPPPIPFGDVLTEGGGCARRNLLRIPPLITESVVDAESAPDGTMAEFTYRLNDPGWLTFPFLLHTHLGRVRFTASEDDSSSVVIDWEVEMRPYEVASPLVEKLTEMTVSSLLRNIQVRLTQPKAVVNIKLPRGNEDLLPGRESFGSVAKETWLGGVLDAHLSDERSAMEQTSSLFRPWTWGRSGTGDENDCVRFRWTDGFITKA